MKLLLAESDSLQATTIWSAAEVATSARLLYPEARAALAAAKRARRVRGRRYTDALVGLEQAFEQMTIVELTDGVARLAGVLAERHGLGASDAIHLASALALQVDVTVSTWDGELRRSALAEGLSVAP